MTSPPATAIALVDCNNFYASCERLFNPKLADKPVVVLSNNDGCIISRSKEARKIVSMGAPLFEVEAVLEENDAEIFSSNYELYGDLSRRVSNTFYEFTPEVEKYSIDEAFLEIQESKKSFEFIGKEIQEKIDKHVGLPVGVGIAETKTLAKVANKIAKKSDKAKGVLDLYKSKYTNLALERTAIEDVWGIGRQFAKKLISFDIKTALKFKYSNLRWVKKNFTVTGGRTLLELNGIRCIPLELTPPPKKSITCSRSFGEAVTGQNELYNAVSHFLMTAVSKMRDNKLSTRSLSVFISTGFHGEYSNEFTYKSVYPSNNLFEIQEWARICLDNIFRKDLIYKKAGVILNSLIPDEGVTERLYQSERLQTRYENLNKAIDEINQKFGKNTIYLACANVGKWQTKAERMSPRYTTRVNEIMRIK